ncbi:unnamed protein product [Bemisia tabaci]|uniref:Ig-like domain-containing protein n=1 Tax=Bemisia tabaci TaxID=7038 RepID=A0A9P0A750_BEMTA|nr:unnamed protein product [Bemisia tabaci]
MSGSKFAFLLTALPTEGPKIFGGRPRYQIGDTVRLNCTSERSKPAAQLHWFINGAPVDNAYLRGPYTRFIGSEELEETTLGLQFKVEPHHFKRDDMKLKCLATIATVYWKSNEKSVEGEKHQSGLLRQDAFMFDSTGLSCSLTPGSVHISPVLLHQIAPPLAPSVHRYPFL